MNKVLNKTTSDKSNRKISKMKILNIIALINSCISLALFIAAIMIYLAITTQHIDNNSFGGMGFTEYVYAADVYKISGQLTILVWMLLLPAAINLIIGILHLPKFMSEPEEKDSKLQKIIMIVNMIGGLIIVNGILASIMLWKGKKNIFSFVVPLMVPVALMAIAPGVVQVTAINTLKKPVDAYNSLMSKEIVRIDEDSRNININLKELTEEKLDFKITARITKIKFGEKIGETYPDDRFLDTLLSVNKTLDKEYKWDSNKVVHVYLNWDKDVKKLRITNMMNAAISKIVSYANLLNKNFVISFENNSNLEEVSGELAVAFYSAKTVFPNGVRENPFLR